MSCLYLLIFPPHTVIQGLDRVIKKEREDLEEKESNVEESMQFEEPNAERVKAEYLSPGCSNSHKHTDSEGAIHTLKKEIAVEESKQESKTKKGTAVCLSSGSSNSLKRKDSNEVTHHAHATPQ